MENNTEQNAWQNIGKARVFARNHLPKKYMTVYMTIVDFSVGFCELKTKNKTIGYFAEQAGVSRNTFVSHVKEMVKLNFIKVNKPHEFVEGGGTVPNSYSISFEAKVNGKMEKMGFMNINGFKSKKDATVEETPVAPTEETTAKDPWKTKQETPEELKAAREKMAKKLGKTA